MDTAVSAEYGVHCSEPSQPVQKSNGQHPEQDRLSIGQTPVPEGDSKEQWANDTPTLGIRGPEGVPEVGSEDVGAEAEAVISHPESGGQPVAPPVWAQEPRPEAVVDWDDLDAGFRAG